MRKKLLLERAALNREIRSNMVIFMKETNKEEALKILATIKELAIRVEEINCKLAHK